MNGMTGKCPDFHWKSMERYGRDEKFSLL